MTTTRKRWEKFSGLENPKYSEEERNYMKQFARGAIPYLISGLLFNIIFITLVIRYTIDFGAIGKTRSIDLQDIQSRIGYVLKYQTPGILWLYVCIHYVIHIRVRSPAMDPLNNSESIVQKPKNILQNSFEQFILSFVSQLVLVTHLSPEQTLSYIPALSFMFILGRITFWLGYPERRSFGFITNMAPTFVTVVYICCKFFKLYF